MKDRTPTIAERVAAILPKSNYIPHKDPAVLDLLFEMHGYLSTLERAFEPKKPEITDKD